MRNDSLISNHFFSILSMGIQMGSSFIVFLILLQLLVPQHLGQWILYTAIFSLAELAKSGLIQNAYIHFSSANGINKKELYASGLVLSMIVAILLGLFVTLISIPLSTALQAPELISLAIYYPIFSFFLSIQRFFEIHLISENNFKKLCISKGIYGLLFITSIVLVEVNGFLDLIILPILQILSITFTLLISITFLSFSLQLKSSSNYLIRKLISYGRYVMGTNLGSMLLNKIDVLILSAFIGPSAVAIYSTASRLINIIEIPLTSISQVSFPRLSKSFQKESSKTTANIFEIDLALAGIILIPISFILFLFSEEVIRIIAGENYHTSSIILKILCATVTFKAIGRFSGISLDAVGLPKLNFYALIASSLLNLILSIILINLFGETGVALATLISVMLTSLCLLYIVKKVIPIEIKNVFQNIKPLYNQILKTLKNEFALR